jgi:hypothetical protein
MPVDTTSVFASVIQEHLELRRRNAALEPEMPLERYMPDDPFQNHPLFKTEEQARIEDTMDGAQSIVDEPTSLEWPAESSFPAPNLPGPSLPAEEGPTGEEPQVQPEEESAEVSEDSLWTRSRDFDWGD